MKPLVEAIGVVSLEGVGDPRPRLNVRSAGSLPIHKTVVDLFGPNGTLVVCLDCRKTWSEGADVPEFPMTCSPIAPPAQLIYVIRGGTLGNYRYWTGDGWDNLVERAIRFADKGSAGAVNCFILQPHVVPIEVVPLRAHL